MSDTPKMQILITPEQLKLGWYELRGIQMIRRAYHVIQQLPSGNYIALVPDMSAKENSQRIKR